MTATPPGADLRALAAEALDSLSDCPPDHWGGRDILDPCVDCQADAVLAAVLLEHRRMVLGEAAEALKRMRPSFNNIFDASGAGMLDDAAEFVRRLGAAAPPAGLSATMPAETAPAVPEDTPGGFHEPDEPTDHIAAAFEHGAHGRTAPPRGQTRRLDVAAALTAAERDVVEKAKAWRKVMPLIPGLDSREAAALDTLAAAVDALPDAGTDQTEDGHG